MHLASVVLVLLINYSRHSTGAAEKCGPKELCDCKKLQDNSGRVLMDCEARHGISLEDICNSINARYNNVTDLNAGRNNIGNVRTNVMEGCWNLTRLDLHYNQMTDLHANAFTSFKHLKVLDLSDNALPVYVPGALNASTLPKTLEELVITGNPLPGSDVTTTLRYPNLVALPHLKRLFIDGKQLDFGHEYSLVNITYLSLASRGLRGNCTLNEVFNTTFNTLTSLKDLNLSSCQLENIHKHAFSKHTHLERLDLSYNRRLGFSPMENITHSLQFTNIQEADFSAVYPTFGTGTMLLKKDVCYLRNTTLKRVYLRSNRLQLIDTNLFMLLPEHIEEIDLSDNIFTFGLYLLQLSCISNVLVLNGSDQNKMHTPSLYLSQPQVPSDLGRPSSSVCPFMSDEYLKQIAHSIKGCVFYLPNDTFPALSIRVPIKVKRLIFRDSNMRYSITLNINVLPLENQIEYADFSGNVFSSLTGSIGPFPKMKYVVLSRCYCSMIGPDFLFPTTENLQLDFNNLGQMLKTGDGLNAFDHLVKLKVLNLSSNGIDHLLPDFLRYQENLEVLDLSFNDLEQLNIHVTHMKQLKTLLVRHNSIHSLTDEVMHVLEDNSKRSRAPFSLDIRDNSISFSCSNLQFLQWLYSYRNNVYGFDGLIFHDEKGSTISAKTFVKEIGSFPERCANYTLELVLGGAGAFLSCCVIIGGLIYRKRWKIRYLLFLVKKRYYGFSRIEEDGGDDEQIHYKYNAFISYSEDDQEFVTGSLLDNLEAQQLELCFHQRDFLVGVPISDNILAAIDNSRWTVIMLSKSYLEKKWCKFEFHMARMESIFRRGEQGCLVVVMLEDIPVERMPSEMTDWLQRNTYIQYTEDVDGQRLFWERLTSAIQS